MLFRSPAPAPFVFNQAQDSASAIDPSTGQPYKYANNAPGGVDLGSLGGIMSTADGFDWSKLLKGLGSLGSKAGDALSTPSGLLTALAGMYALSGGNTAKPYRGYTGGIPSRTAIRTTLPNTINAPEYGSGRMGKRYMTDIEYAAEGGIMGLAVGGSAKDPRYLSGSTDGMADKIATHIDGNQKAALSHGEFVIPADVVSHLGNGNSDAGADVLYKMMDKVRHARTGTKKQGKEIDPTKFTPGGLANYESGGIAGYAGGGVVAFAGTNGSLVDNTATGPAVANPTSSESNLSEWAGPYVTDYLSKGQALANTPYQAYTGPLTAGSSPLQQQAFNTAGGLTTPTGIAGAADAAGAAGTKMGGMSYTPVGSNFTPAAAQQYMNPYIQSALDPQIAEARRQSQITQMGNASKLTQAGAFGGSRGALMDSETQRNLGTNLAGITGAGYNTAYNKAMEQFNADQTRAVGEAQFGSNFGLNAAKGQVDAATAQGSLGSQANAAGIANLNAQLNAGNTQRGIESEDKIGRAHV